VTRGKRNLILLKSPRRGGGFKSVREGGGGENVFSVRKEMDIFRGEKKSEKRRGGGVAFDLGDFWEGGGRTLQVKKVEDSSRQFPFFLLRKKKDFQGKKGEEGTRIQPKRVYAS